MEGLPIVGVFFSVSNRIVSEMLPVHHPRTWRNGIPSFLLISNFDRLVWSGLFPVGFCWLTALFLSHLHLHLHLHIAGRTCREPRCGLMISRSASTSSHSKKASNLIDQLSFRETSLGQIGTVIGNQGVFNLSAISATCTDTSARLWLGLALLTGFLCSVHLASLALLYF